MEEITEAVLPATMVTTAILKIVLKVVVMVMTVSARRMISEISILSMIRTKSTINTINMTMAVELTGAMVAESTTTNRVYLF